MGRLITLERKNRHLQEVLTEKNQHIRDQRAKIDEITAKLEAAHEKIDKLQKELQPEIA